MTDLSTDLDPRREEIIRRAIALASVAHDATEPRPPGEDDLARALAWLGTARETMEWSRAFVTESEKRLTELMENILALVGFNYSVRATVTDKDDIFDGMAAGLNMLAEELSTSTVSKAYANNIIESMNDMLIVVGPDGLMKTVNQATCDLTGYSKEELYGQALSSIILHTHSDELVANRGERQRERVCRTKGGDEIPVSFSAAVMRDAHSVLQGIVCVARDLTDAKAAEAKRSAEAANKAKSEFLASMSHELRTPLNGILGYAQILRRSKNLSEEDLHGLKVISESGTHLLMLISDLLDLAKIEARKVDLQVMPFHLSAFLRSTTEMCRIRAEDRGIAFYTNLIPPLPEGVLADQRRLRQVLINLLGNAIKFTEKGSVTFTVRALPNGDGGSDGDAPGGGAGQESHRRTYTLRFEIEDTGMGMSADQVRQLFQPFRQVGDAKKKLEGTGLGLAISQRLVNLMGSSIQVRSAPGEGSAFWMDLALAESSDWEKTAAATARGQVTGYEGGRRRILVVDDKWENRAMLVKMLEAVGFETAEAEEGQQGLEKAIAESFDLIITDLIMPVLDGWEMIRRLRSAPTRSGAKILASSASAFVADQQRCFDAGADDFLPKPLQLDELFEKMQRLLDLTWVYEQPNESQTNEAPGRASGEVEGASQSEVLPPSDEDLRALIDLARKGLVNRIHKLADNLDRTDPKFAGFTTHLRRLLREFRMGLVESFITGHIRQNGDVVATQERPKNGSE